MSESYKEEIGTDDTTKRLATTIDSKLGALRTFSSRRCIYRVPERLRVVKNEAYTPSMFSIGPYHCKEPKLHAMEIHKLKYLQTFLRDSQGEENSYIYLKYVKDNENLIRGCYADSTTNLSSTDFIEMVLLDSVFIIEVFRRSYAPSEIEEDDFMFGRPNLANHVWRDISLAENQLPLFVIQGLYTIAFRPDMDDIVPHFIDIARYCYNMNTTSIPSHIDTQDRPSVVHLLDLLRNKFLPSKPREELITNIGNGDSTGTRGIDTQDRPCVVHLLDLLRNKFLPSKPREELITNVGNGDSMGTIFCPNVTRLWEAGIKFQAEKGDEKRLPDIRFDKKNATLTIPEIIVDDGTESQLRNLIAFEQHHYREQQHISEYQFLMDCLINTSKDVELLVEKGVLKNSPGSHDEVSDLFNNLGTHVCTDPRGYYYEGLTSLLSAHCDKRWNHYKFVLRHTYFRYPWTVISVIYAAVLLILTIIQVVSGLLSVP